MSGAWLVLPTFNEAENIEPIVRAALPHLASTGLRTPDPRGGRQLPRRHRRDRRPAGRRDRRGRGAAPRAQGGDRARLPGRASTARSASGADLLLEMDSDFSHDPADLPRLIAAAEDADLVLGSRYVPGGGVTDWGLGRRLISRGGSLYAKLLLGMPVNDLTGGFKCFRRAVLEDARPVGRGHRRLRLPDRDDLPRGQGGLPRDARCRSCSGTAGWERPRCLRGSPSRRSGRCPRCASSVR